MQIDKQDFTKVVRVAAEFCDRRRSATDSSLHGNNMATSVMATEEDPPCPDPWVSTWGPARSPPASPAGTWCPPWCPHRRTSAAPSSPAASAPCTGSLPGRTPGESPSRLTSPGGSVTGKHSEQTGCTLKAVIRKLVGFGEKVDKQFQTLFFCHC